MKRVSLQSIFRKVLPNVSVYFFALYTIKARIKAANSRIITKRNIK